MGDLGNQLTIEAQIQCGHPACRQSFKGRVVFDAPFGRHGMNLFGSSDVAVLGYVKEDMPLGWALGRALLPDTGKEKLYGSPRLYCGEHVPKEETAAPNTGP